jgi:regulator of protease activity HflC (stomatin/prohibitin superfamily)
MGGFPFPDGFSILVVVLLFVALVLVSMGVRAVPQGQECTVERFRRYTRTLGPGLNLIVPFVDRIGARLNMMEQVLEVPEQEVITRDNAMVRVDGVVFFQVIDAAKAAYEVTGLSNAILNLTMTNIRTVMGSMDLDELLSRRDEINVRLLQVVDEATTPWGIKVTRIEIKNITPPLDLVESMGRQMKAERDKRAVVLAAEGDKTAAILKADGEKQAAILEAEGRREAAFRDAEARERLAQAEANAAAMMSRALAEGSLQAANYFIAQRYLEALTAFARSPNQKTLILPVETTGILGSLAGIGELVRETLTARPSGGEGSGGGGAAPGPAGGGGPWRPPAGSA